MADEPKIGPEEARRRLGLQVGADPQTLKAAFRAAVRRWHPDRPGGDGSALREAIEAYRALTNRPALRPRADVRAGEVGERAWRIVEVDEALLAHGGRLRLSDAAPPVWLPREARRFGILRVSDAGGHDVLVRLRAAPAPPSAFETKRRAFAEAWAA